MKTPSPFHTLDHLDFLMSCKDIRDAGSEPVSFQELSEKIGLRSRTKLRRMLKGSLPLSKAALRALADFYDLSKAEADYLDLLRAFHQTTDSDTALALYTKIVDARRRAGETDEVHQLEEDRYRVLEKWYYLPLLYYFHLNGDHMVETEADALAVSRDFKSKISVAEVLEGISFLLELGLLKREGGVLRRTHSGVQIFSLLPNPLAKKFHEMMIDLARDAVFGMPIDKRHLMSLTLNVETKMLPVVRKKIEEFFMQMNQSYCSEQADSIYQMSLQLVHLATKGDGGEKEN